MNSITATATSPQAGDSSSTIQAPTPLTQRFPQSFQMYYTKSNISTTTVHLGESKDKPLYIAALNTSWSGKSSTTLHSGPTTNTSVLAIAKTEKLLSNNSTITISSPPLTHTISEKLTVNYHLSGGASHSFVVLTGTGTGTGTSTESVYPEKFEWRPSRNQEITGGKWLASGWKLVRLDARKPVSTVCAATEDPEAVVASDGGEVVAVSVDGVSFNTKVATFKFLGTGATGKLGESWAIMAVVSAVRIWQMRWLLGTT